MIFTDLRFVALFVGCWLTFRAVASRHRPLVLAAWGVLFYTTYAGVFVAVVLLLTSAVVSARRRWQAIAVGAVIVGVLLWFKLRESVVLPQLTGTTAVLIPLGLSYLAFELLHVVIDRRRGRLPDVDVAPMLAFIFFVPCRIAGPIRRYPEFTSAVEQASPSTVDVYEGLLRILLGFGKKFLLADTLALTSLELDDVATTTHAWTVTLAFGLQLFFDFSAYSDIAIGLSRTLGIRVPENFNYPYLAPNIREFWSRWHISLSHWVRDYVFVPTGRRLFAGALRPYPAVIAAISYLVTFALVGAWHGVTAAFVVWGLYHGALLSVHHAIQAHLPMAVAGSRWYRSWLGSTLGRAITFACVTIGWLPFMTDLDRATTLFWLMMGAR